MKKLIMTAAALALLSGSALAGVVTPKVTGTTFTGPAVGSYETGGNGQLTGYQAAIDRAKEANHLSCGPKRS